MKQSKCRSTDDGTASCVVSVMGQRCACPDEAVASPSLPASEHSTTRKAQSKQHTSLRWKTIRSGLLFVLACLTSPCCTPLFVPLGLALLAGTPLALWLTAYLGWVYGAFTLVCVSSLVFAFRPLRTPPISHHPSSTERLRQLVQFHAHPPTHSESGSARREGRG